MHTLCLCEQREHFFFVCVYSIHIHRPLSLCVSISVFFFLARTKKISSIENIRWMKHFTLRFLHHCRVLSLDIYSRSTKCHRPNLSIPGSVSHSRTTSKCMRVVMGPCEHPIPFIMLS